VRTVTGGSTELDENGFRDFCVKSGIDKSVIQSSVEMVRYSEAFLKREGAEKNLSALTVPDLERLLAHMIEDRSNSEENLLALLRYARFSDNQEAEVFLLEVMGGSKVMNILSETLRHVAGDKKHDDIFGGLDIPPLGALPKDKSQFTKEFMERLQSRLDEKKWKELLLSGPHAHPKEDYVPDRSKFLASKSIDDYLERRHREFLDLLARDMREKTLFYTQEIDEAVLEHIRNNPIEVRKGNTLQITKIPYMAKEYLREKDERKKRYYYCHCPWARESIMSGAGIPPGFCYCSAGHAKRPWDVIFDQPVEAEVLETVLKGDIVCRFSIRIPEKYQQTKEPVNSRNR
jgi:hypothetical protein